MKTYDNKAKKISHEFIAAIPSSLEENKLYVCIEYATVVHQCFCGCGMEVVTPLTPTDWELRYNGVTISLNPSVGNWSFDCKSHYWIVKNAVIWSPEWSDDEIAYGRQESRFQKDSYYGEEACPIERIPDKVGQNNRGQLNSNSSFLDHIKKWWLKER